MANFCKFIVSALIAFLVAQISWAEERLAEGKEKAVINSKTSAATSNPEKKNDMQENQSYWYPYEAESLSFSSRLGKFKDENTAAIRRYYVELRVRWWRDEALN